MAAVQRLLPVAGERRIHAGRQIADGRINGRFLIEWPLYGVQRPCGGFETDDVAPATASRSLELAVPTLI
jgi:hypothetical protein